jgi:hypothetical protein
MLKRRAVLSIAVLATLFSGTVNSTFAADKMSKGQVHFKVLIENISDKNGLTAPVLPSSFWSLWRSLLSAISARLNFICRLDDPSERTRISICPSELAQSQ